MRHHNQERVINIRLDITSRLINSATSNTTEKQSEPQPHEVHHRLELAIEAARPNEREPAELDLTLHPPSMRPDENLSVDTEAVHLPRRIFERRDGKLPLRPTPPRPGTTLH